MNGHGLDTPLVMQLCDKWGNPSPDQRIEVEMNTLYSELKVQLRGREAGGFVLTNIFF